MNEPITYVGIDAHKRELHVAMLVGDASTPVTWTARNEPRAIDRLRRKLERAAPRARRGHRSLGSGGGGVYMSPFGVPYFTVSDSGALTYVPTPDDTLVWVDEAGTERPAADERAAYEHPRVSPDGRLIAVDFGDDRQVWILDVERQIRTPLTTEGANFLPTWTPDGGRVVFVRTGQWDMYWKAADGTNDAEPLLEMPYLQAPGSFSPGGILAYYEIHPETSRDLWTLEPGRDPQPFLVTASSEAQPSFSPDGQWIAYSFRTLGNLAISGFAN